MFFFPLVVRETSWHYCHAEDCFIVLESWPLLATVTTSLTWHRAPKASWHFGSTVSTGPQERLLLDFDLCWVQWPVTTRLLLPFLWVNSRFSPVWSSPPAAIPSLSIPPPLTVMSVYSVDWCISLLLHPSPPHAPNPPISLPFFHPCLLLDLLYLSIRPSLVQSQLDMAFVLLACSYRSSYMCGWDQSSVYLWCFGMESHQCHCLTGLYHPWRSSFQLPPR